MATDYTPIACIMYDRLEELAVLKKDVRIIYIEDKNEKSIIDKIIDFRTLNKEEFLITKSGIEIRLDKLISVNEIEFKNTTC